MAVPAPGRLAPRAVAEVAAAGSTRQVSSAGVKFFYRRPPVGKVELTFVLIDWSCRESFHFLDYLNQQTCDRSSYEILWLEYYDRRSAELCQRIDEASAAGRPPVVDTYAALGMPANVYYHKHLLYNAGLLLARGDVVCFCDSDAMARPDLVASIVEQFRADPNIVLHLDEVRNHDTRFYPFDYPEFSDVEGYGCLNWINGRPAGLLDPVDPLHTRNYGACMCARRDDLVAIGGADLHGDYLGHTCGPYEMTFRLVNAGKREVWHDRQWLYHVWHPGQAGDANYAGPHDGAQMSLRALESRATGRVLPWSESAAMRQLRTGSPLAAETLLEKMVSSQPSDAWRVDNLVQRPRKYRLGKSQIEVFEAAQENEKPERPIGPRPAGSLFGLKFTRRSQARVLPVLVAMLLAQLLVKCRSVRFSQAVTGTRSWRNWLRKPRALVLFIARMARYDAHLARRSWATLAYLKATGRSELAFYGDGDAARLLAAMLRPLGMVLRGICLRAEPIGQPDRRGRAWNMAQLVEWKGPIVIATFVDSEEMVDELVSQGIDRERLIVLD